MAEPPYPTADMSVAAPVGRFAPSPTGPLHFGSLVAALASWLDVRRAGGRWLLRIEDIDTPRVVAGSADAILRTLDACGLHWDGAIEYQSRRLALYAAALDRLWTAGQAYVCTCTRRQLALAAPRGAGDAVYPGTCRTAARPRTASGAVRVRTHAQPIAFTDRIQGLFSQRVECAVGDFVIRRADGLFGYQLVVVVDDAVQGVTDVVRGADLLDSTPRQIHLQRLLGYPTPRYAHLPLATTALGTKLAKSSGAAAVDDARPVAALWDALRFLGQKPDPALRRTNPNELLAWATAAWQPDAIPATFGAPFSAS